MNSGKVAISLVAAAAIGAVLGILFAPAKGSALRRKIKRMSGNEVDILKDKYDEYSDIISQKYEKAKEDIVDFAHQSMKMKDQKVKTAENN